MRVELALIASIFLVSGCSSGGSGSAPSNDDAALDSVSGSDSTVDTTPQDASSDATSDAPSCPTGKTPCGGSCVDLSNDPNHCGKCDVACDSTCCEGICDGTPIAQHQSLVTQIGLDATSVYWGTRGSGATVMKVVKDGSSPPTTLVSFPGGAVGLLVDDGFVYFLNPSSDIVRVPTTGGPYKPIFSVSEDVVAFTVDATNVFWSTYLEPTNNLAYGPKTGGSGAPFGSTITWIVQELASDGTYLYGNGDYTSIDVLSPKTGAILGGLTGTHIQGIAADGATGTLFWHDCPTKTTCNVYSIPTSPLPTSSSSPTLLGTTSADPSTPSLLAFDATTVYFTDPNANTVYKVPRSGAGGAAIVVAKNQRSPRAIAVDDRYVYWADQDADGAIHRACK